MVVEPFIVYGDNVDFDVASLGAPLTASTPTGNSTTYELPGETIRFTAVFVSGSSGRVVIYGRAN